MISNGGIFGASSSGPTFIDAGVYADDSDGYGHAPISETYWKRMAVSFWYRNDYANTTGTFLYGGYHGSQDHGGVFIGGDGYVYFQTKYNNSHYHNLKSSSLSTAQRATNTWHHFHMRLPSSGNLTVHIDGTQMISNTVSDYTDMFGRYHGYIPNPSSYPISSLSGGPSWSFKGCTYMAQLVYSDGSSPHSVTDVLNTSDGTPIDVQDIDGSGTDLATDYSGADTGRGFWLFGANGTTSSLTHNSATDGGGDSGFTMDSDYVLTTDTNIFPVTGITT